MTTQPPTDAALVTQKDRCNPDYLRKVAEALSRVEPDKQGFVTMWPNSRDALVKDLHAAAEALSTRQQPEAGRGGIWLDPATAPKDGTILELVVDYTDGHSALHDAVIAPTIGWNDLANTGVDKWHIVGWDWCQDHIRDGAGLIRAWRPSRLNVCDETIGTLPAIDGER